MARRTPREFDRGQFGPELLDGLLPDHHLNQTTNEVWKANRYLVNGLMSPSFLNNIAAPQVYHALSELVGLWKQKTQLSNGLPFAVTTDVCHTALDGLWAFTFGPAGGEGASHTARESLRAVREISLPGNTTNVAEWRSSDLPPTLQAVLTMTERLGWVASSPFPRPTHWLISCLPAQRKAHRIKEDFIKDQLDKTVERLDLNDPEAQPKITCAIDYILHREHSNAAKQGRPPNYYSRVIFDEVFNSVPSSSHNTNSLRYSASSLPDTTPAVPHSPGC